MQRNPREQMNITHDCLWPKGWSMPEPGATVSAGPIRGFVEYVEFDVDAERIVIMLR